MSITELARNLGLERDEFMEILAIYMERTNSDLEGLKRALNNGDAEEAHRCAHSIKGASANLGLIDLCELAKGIDDNARSHVLTGAERLVQDFEEKYGELVDTLKG